MLTMFLLDGNNRIPWSQRFFLIFHRMGELRESREAANTSREAVRKKNLWLLWTWISLSYRRQLSNASIRLFKMGPMEAYQSCAYQPLMFPLGWWGVVSFDLLNRGQCACLRECFHPQQSRRLIKLDILRSKNLHFSFCKKASGLPNRKA